MSDCPPGCHVNFNIEKFLLHKLISQIDLKVGKNTCIPNKGEEFDPLGINLKGLKNQ